jgi:hypothetical protein
VSYEIHLGDKLVPNPNVYLPNSGTAQNQVNDGDVDGGDCSSVTGLNHHKQCDCLLLSK